jgi:hypothetical protein
VLASRTTLVVGNGVYYWPMTGKKHATREFA